MATTKTLSDLINEVRYRCDMVGSNFVGDSELTGYINSSYYELYDILIQKYGDDYFVATPVEITADGVNDKYDLPAGFYKLAGVDLKIFGTPTGYVALKPFNFADRNRFALPSLNGIYATLGGAINLGYRLLGDQLWLAPVPAAGQIIRIWYVPRWSPLVNSTDKVDGISGWLEYVVVDCAIKCLQKEESDTSVLLEQKRALLHRLESVAENRDVGSPATVTDSTNTNSWPGPYGHGGFML